MKQLHSNPTPIMLIFVLAKQLVQYTAHTKTPFFSKKIFGGGYRYIPLGVKGTYHTIASPERPTLLNQ